MPDNIQEQMYEVEFIRDTRPREADEIIRQGDKVKMPESSMCRWDRRGAVKVLGPVKMADKPNTGGK